MAERQVSHQHVGESAGTADEQDLYQSHEDWNSLNGIDIDPYGRGVPYGDRRSQGANRQVPRDRTRDRGRFVPADEATRFWSKVDKTDGCWLWTGKPNSDGYGRFKVTVAPGRYRHVRAHVWAWEHEHGPLADGLTIDHVRGRGCDHKNCVRPDHLEPVTRVENIRRAAAWRRAHPINGQGRPA